MVSNNCPLILLVLVCTSRRFAAIQMPNLDMVIVSFDNVNLHLYLYYNIQREAGEAARAVSYLPKDKQFLLTRNGKQFFIALLLLLS